MSSPAQPFNYGMNAAAFSTGSSQINSYATSIAQNLPGAIRCPAVSVTVATGTTVALPASVFSAGSGIYAVFCDGNGNNDLSAVGSVTITPAGTISDSKGFFCNNLSPTPVVTVAAGPPVTATAATPYTILYMTGALGAYIPSIFQNLTASIVYSVSAIKLAN